MIIEFGARSGTQLRKDNGRSILNELEEDEVKQILSIKRARW